MPTPHAARGLSRGKDSPSRPRRASIGVSVGFARLMRRAERAFQRVVHAPSSVSISSGFGFFGGSAMTKLTDFDALLHAVGEALTNWSHVETGLFRIFHEAIQCPALGPSSATFIAVENFRAKRSMTDAALRSSKKFLPHIKGWEALNKRIESEAKERNRLAHSQVFLLQRGKKQFKAVLGPYGYDVSFLTAKGLPDQRKIKNISSVKHINQRFCELGSDLSAFARKIHQP